MPSSGQTIHNPATGESITFVRTSHETEGKLVELAFSVAAGGATPEPHVHPRQTETFEIHEGRCRVHVDEREHELTAGQRMTVPPGVSHTWTAVSELRMTVTLEPAQRADEFFEDLFALANAGCVNAKGLPTPLHFAVLLDEYRDLVYLAAAPVALQKATMGILAKIGRTIGKGAKGLPHRAAAPGMASPTPR
ncbi:MAG: cupin domain-containing protein [Solirubrobacterales bacterium]|nr:cupin domain-containing protein [Solirubrobacterales bacterium]